MRTTQTIPHSGVCRACGSSRLEVFYEVPDVPVHSCLMVDSREAALGFPRGQLRLEFCPSCGFVQNGLYDASLQSYSPDYEETQAFSPRFKAFLEDLADDQIARHGLRDKQVVEIGCGKGEFLMLLSERGPSRGIGIDPGYRPERTTSAAKDRVRFIRDHYGERYADLTGDYVACRHTLEHIGPVHEFVARIRHGLRAGTPVFFELPDLERVLVERGFWDIYYEHCSYFTAGSLARLLTSCSFTVTRLAKAYDDQYLLLDGIAGRGEEPALAIADDLEQTQAQVAAFRNDVAAKRRGIERLARSLAAEGRRLAIWGSGSKAVALLTSTDIGDAVRAVVDINPHKHGKFLVGSGHEIVAPASLAALEPDCVLVMNPVYEEEIGAHLASLGIAPRLLTLEGLAPA